MTAVDRRKFLATAALAGGGIASGSLVLASGAAPGREGITAGSRTMAFTATADLPQPPLHGYLVHHLDGQIDLEQGTGEITARVLAGPSTTTGAALPGFTRKIQVTSARNSNGQVVLQGRDEASRKQATVTVDLRNQAVWAPYADRQVQHQLDQHSA